MKGRLLGFSVQTNSGIISGDDGKRYTFIGAQWRETTIPQRGMYVDFEVQDTEALGVYRAVGGSGGGSGSRSGSKAGSGSGSGSRSGSKAGSGSGSGSRSGSKAGSGSGSGSRSGSKAGSGSGSGSRSGSKAGSGSGSGNWSGSKAGSGWREAANKDRVAAGVLGILLGGLGLHKFYLGYAKEGVIHLIIFFVGMIPFFLGTLAISVVGLIEGIIYIAKTQEEFEETYIVNTRPWF